MPRETIYPTTRPTWLAETVAQARPPGQRSKSAKNSKPKRTVSPPAKRPPPISNRSTPAVALGTKAFLGTFPDASNIVTIMNVVCTYHAIPVVLGLTVLDLECGPILAKGFTHPNGLMQTSPAVRKAMIPKIPRPLKLQLLDREADDNTDDTTLNESLRDEFPKRAAVQIAVGVQKIVEGLRAFNGYVALALIAYHAGEGDAASIATRGRATRRPAGTTNKDWEKACNFGAGLLHQPARAVIVKPGSWLCDAQSSTWKKADFQVWDPTGKVQLIAYDYLRFIPGCIHSSPPSVACNAKTKSIPHSGTGKRICADTRLGALDKLYMPTQLRPELLTAAGCRIQSPELLAAGCLLQPPVLDVRPLKVEAGRFVWV